MKEIDFEKAKIIVRCAFDSRNLKTVSWIKQNINELDDDQEVFLVSKEQTLPMKIWKSAQCDDELDLEEKAELIAYKRAHPEFNM